MEPLDVVVVTPKPSRGAVIGRLIAVMLIAPLTAGWALMLLLPLAAESLGTPSRHPSFWQCVGLMFLVRAIFNMFRSTSYPTLTSERQEAKNGK